jgi:hypothetical protein
MRFPIKYQTASLLIVSAASSALFAQNSVTEMHPEHASVPDARMRRVAAV